MHLQALRGLLRRLLRPQLVDQTLPQDDLVSASQQDREQRALLPAGQGQRAPVQEDFHRPQDAVLQSGHMPHEHTKALGPRRHNPPV